MSKIYISGPIVGNVVQATAETIEINKAKFAEAVAFLAKWYPGTTVKNPLDVPGCHDGSCEGVRAAGLDHTWACFMRHDLRALTYCDSIAMLPNWRESKGARLEFHVAKELGFDVWFFNNPMNNLTKGVEK